MNHSLPVYGGREISVSKENPIHQQDQALIEAIHSQHLERIGVLGDEAIKFQDASYAVGRQRGSKEANETLLALVIRMRSYMDQAGIDPRPESMNPMEKLASDIDIALEAFSALNPA
ncbi:hypothetical protein [Pseudomonas sp. UBA5706]|nr:hypothetical protein [Pseudomonas sp. UBA5706]